MTHELIAAGRSLLAEASQRCLTFRALGGVAVAMRCPSALSPPLTRTYADLDFITSERDAPAIAEMLPELGFSAERRFNNLHGRRRMLFESPDWHVDVLVGRFAMCHELDLRERLTLHPDTLTPADLLLTKLQVARLNRKDVVDLTALLIDHELTTSEAGVNLDYVTRLLSSDWGWWKTSTQTLVEVQSHLAGLGLAPDQHALVDARLQALAQSVTRAPKTRRWRLRARVGTRVPWYIDPEELA